MQQCNMQMKICKYEFTRNLSFMCRFVSDSLKFNCKFKLKVCCVNVFLSPVAKQVACVQAMCMQYAMQSM